MLFNRRKKPGLFNTLRSWVWPRSGFKRAGLYVWHRIARLPGTAHSIAAGFASGAAVSFTPFLGLHFLLAFVLAWMVRGNMIAAAIGTVIGNPWTFPLIYTLTGQIGALMLGQDVTASVPVWDWDSLVNSPLDYMVSFLPIVFPLLIGSIPTGIVIWVLFYSCFRVMIEANRQRRLDRKQAKLDNAVEVNGNGSE